MSILPRMRTLDECYNELKQIDNNTSVTKYFIRQLAISGQIHCVMVGRKRLINLDNLIDFLNHNTAAEHQDKTINEIIPIRQGVRK